MSCKTITLILLMLCLLAPHGFSAETEPVMDVGVRTLMKSPEQYAQPVRVAGVVSQVVVEAKMIGLIDLEEFKTCNKVTCASLVLPVRWAGAMPEVGQKLTATGKIQKEGERFVFIADDLVVASPE